LVKLKLEGGVFMLDAHAYVVGKGLELNPVAEPALAHGELKLIVEP
jgi:hypothetical protein